MNRMTHRALAFETPELTVETLEPAVEYPDSDGQPMAESDFQLRAMLYVLSALRTHFRDRADVYVGGDMFIYYEKGSPGAVVAPDVFVVSGVAQRAEAPRRSYKLWEEGKGPDFVLEVISDTTWKVDRDEKPALYAALGVEEYWLFDPTGEYLTPPLRGMRLESGRYRALARRAPLNGGRRSVHGIRPLHSTVLDLDLRVERSGELRLHDPESGKELLGHTEVQVALLAKEEALRQEEAARRKEAAGRRQEAAMRRKAEAALQEEAAGRRQEAAGRQTAEARVAELEARLRALQGEAAPTSGA